MSFQILLSDDVHLHRKNFASLFEFIETTSNVECHVLQDGRALWNRYGDYAGVKEIESIAELFRSLNERQLKEINCKLGAGSINAFDVARAEILSYVMAQDEGWYTEAIPNKNDFIFSKLFSENNTLLRLNIAAVVHWCNIYTKELLRYPLAKVVIVFSGSQIYQRLLLEYCRSVWARSIVVESFQTGNDFHFEERYTPLTAGSDIRYPTVFNGLKLPGEAIDRQNEYNKALNKIINGRNKNVSQPEDAVLPRFADDKSPCILISAQVQNDFSIIESKLCDINALSNYKRLIEEIIATTDFNIVVKTHPWERHKTHLKRPFIYEELAAFMREKPLDQQIRVHICEDANIKKLLNKCDAFVTLTSQSVLEACLYSGLRPFTMGFPFYYGKGFTNDYQDAGDLVASLRTNRSKWCLDLSAYEAFVDFVARLLQAHLPSVHKSGLSLIRERVLGRQFVEVGMTQPSKPKKQAAPINEKELVLPGKQFPAGATAGFKVANSSTKAAIQPAQKVPLFQRPLVPIVRPFVAKIGNKKDVREFDDNPAMFFAKLRNPWYRGVGAVLFPPPRGRV